MMTVNDQGKLIDALMATAEVMGNEIKPNVALFMSDDLKSYPLNNVLSALVRVRRECSGKLSLKMIMDILAPTGGWLSANEAWAVALPAVDESMTVVWTSEMAKAWEIAKPILDAGDRIGARMAFIPAYDRFVDQAKVENREPVYEISVGWDSDMRDMAIKKAQTAGLLPCKNDTAAISAPSMFDSHVELYRRHFVSQRWKDLATQIKDLHQSAWADRVRQQEYARGQQQMRKTEAIKKLQERSV